MLQSNQQLPLYHFVNRGPVSYYDRDAIGWFIVFIDCFCFNTVQTADVIRSYCITKSTLRITFTYISMISCIISSNNILFFLPLSSSALIFLWLMMNRCKTQYQHTKSALNTAYYNRHHLASWMFALNQNLGRILLTIREAKNETLYTNRNSTHQNTTLSRF